MKKIGISLLLVLLLLTACSQKQEISKHDEINIQLSDEKILVDDKELEANNTSAVYVANDIIYYESGKDFTYGEGTEADSHSVEEADSHTVVHITEPGTYRVSGLLSKGQIAVDLGEDAKENPEAVVTLVLSGVDITCEVAPAIIFYNVYECGNTDTESATKDVDTGNAGANVVIEDGTTNPVNGSYVARIYKADTVVLNEDGTEVEDAKKLHKYDGAFYSKMSMNINGAEQGDGVLNIYAQNEGLDSELHLTINGANINIYSGNDGINTNEDGVSVTTINGGNLNIEVTGETGEGDGIDSNGWLVINGGSVTASACADSADAGIDSDMGIHINGGTVIAGGHMLDRIEDGGQTYVTFNFMEKQAGNTTLTLKNAEDAALMDVSLKNTYSVLVYSSPELLPGTYTLWSGTEQLSVQGGGMGGNFGEPGMKPEGDFKPEGMEPPEKPEEMERPEGEKPPEKPEGDERYPDENRPENIQEATTAFEIVEGANMFGVVTTPQVS